MLTDVSPSCCLTCAGLPAEHAVLAAQQRFTGARCSAPLERLPGGQVASAGRVGSPGSLTRSDRCWCTRLQCENGPLLDLCVLSHLVPAAAPAAPMDASDCSQTRSIIPSHPPLAALHQLPPSLTLEPCRPAPLFDLSDAAGSACNFAPLALQVAPPSPPRLTLTSDSDSAYTIYSDSTLFVGQKSNRRSSLMCHDANNRSWTDNRNRQQRAATL